MNSMVLIKILIILITLEEPAIRMRSLMPSQSSFTLVTFATEAARKWLPVAVSQHMSL